jgi:hypothetical protein
MMPPKKPTNGDVTKMIDDMDEKEAKEVFDDPCVQEILKRWGVDIK